MQADVPPARPDVRPARTARGAGRADRHHGILDHEWQQRPEGDHGGAGRQCLVCRESHKQGGEDHSRRFGHRIHDPNLAQRPVGYCRGLGWQSVVYRVRARHPNGRSDHPAGRRHRVPAAFPSGERTVWYRGGTGRKPVGHPVPAVRPSSEFGHRPHHDGRVVHGIPAARRERAPGNRRGTGRKSLVRHGRRQCHRPDHDVRSRHAVPDPDGVQRAGG